MDFFQHRYYRLTKTFMTLVGYWPYQSARTRFTLFVLLIFVGIVHIASQIVALVKYRNEQDIVIDCIITLCFDAGCTVKGLGCVWYRQQIIKLLSRIRVDWQVWARDREINILHKYAEQGRKMSLAFTADTCLVAFIYIAQPVIPKIIDVLLKNGTAPGQFPFPVDYYFFDMQKYYFYIIMYISVSLFFGTMIVAISENMLIIYVQHVCGVFAALGCKLQRIGNNNKSLESDGTSYALYRRNMAELASCIDRHNDAIDFANLVGAIYTWTMLYVLGFGTIMLNAVGLQILHGRSDPEATVKFIGIAFTLILHLYIDCHISQVLTDHSISIRVYLHDSQWYKLGPEAQNLLQFMIMRCSVFCKLTAANVLIFSKGTFLQVMRTIMSYFTFLRSMHM